MIVANKVDRLYCSFAQNYVCVWGGRDKDKYLHHDKVNIVWTFVAYGKLFTREQKYSIWLLLMDYFLLWRIISHIPWKVLQYLMYDVGIDSHDGLKL